MLTEAIAARVGSYSASQPRIVPTGKLWPNGEFSLGYVRDGVASESGEESSYHTGGRFLTAKELDERLEAMNELLDEVERFYSMSAQAGIVGLTLSNVWNSHKQSPPTKYGLKGITGHGSKMLRSACWLLEERLGKDDVVMVTLTVPTLGRTARKKLAESWGVLTNRLVQKVSRDLIAAGRPAAIAGCVEIQTARLKKYQQGYLHFHFVCPKFANKGGTFAVQAVDLRSWWKAAIERIIGCELPSLPRIETAPVETSVEGYLGKYLSKGTGAELEQFIGDLGEDSVPGQWWFMSAPMREAVKSGTRSGRNAGAVLDAMVNHLLEMGTGQGFEYIRHIDCDLGGLKVTVGWVGRLSREVADELREFCESS